MSINKVTVTDLAIFGGASCQARPLPVGQLFFPEWNEYKKYFEGIFDRQYYTNHGPLTQQFEDKLAVYLGVKHAIAVTNATIGLVMALESLDLKGKVIVPSFTFIATAQALLWAGLEPAFCDVDKATHQITPALVEPLITDDVSAILAVNLWGGCCDLVGLQRLANEHNLRLIYDSAHAFGCETNGVPIGGFGDAEVFSFHATKFFGTTEGGCITTNDDAIANKLRNIRSSYGSGPVVVPVVKTSNGRMSEAQAAIGLMNFDSLARRFAENIAAFALYRQNLDALPGIHLVEPQNVSKSNFQYVIGTLDATQFGLSRNELLGVLKAEGIIARRYFYPSAHHSIPFRREPKQQELALPNTEYLNECLIQLPIGALVKHEDIERIGTLLQFIHHNARAIHAKMVV
jgi:dTDP-4-amino-4,6-dideoxygalactose transaminase